MSNKRTVAIGYPDEVSITTTVCSTDGHTINIDYVLHLPNGIPKNESLDTSSLTKGTELVTAVVGDYCSPGAVIRDYSPAMIGVEKKKRGVDGDTHHAEIIEVNGTGLYVALERAHSRQLMKILQVICPTAQQHTLTNWLLTMYYAYLRCYLDLQTTAVVVNITKHSISLLVVNSEYPIWAGARAYEDPNSLYTQIAEMVDLGKVFLGSQPTLMLVSGMAAATDVVALKALSITENVELFNIFRNDAFKIGNVDRFTREELTRNSHVYMMTVAAAAMAIEGCGVNLSDSDTRLSHTLPLERSIYIQRSISTVVVDNISNASQELLPVFYQRKWLIAAALLLCLILPTVRYFGRQKTINGIQTQISAEKARAKTLETVKARNDAFKEKQALIEQRLQNIQDIRARQLTVRTVLDQVDQRVPSGLVFSEYEVNGTSVSIKGVAPDRTAVTAFANTLGQSIGKFSDVTVYYDDKTNTGSFVIGTNYIGKVPPNDIKVANTDLAALTGR